MYLHLIFSKLSWMNLIFCLVWTWYLQPSKFKFEIDKKSSSSNLIFPTWFFQKSGADKSKVSNQFFFRDRIEV